MLPEMVLFSLVEEMEKQRFKNGKSLSDTDDYGSSNP